VAVRTTGHVDARLPWVKIEKLTGNAFIAHDLVDAPCATGVVRVAPKVLQGGAKAMARTTTYTFAVRGLKVGGASAGISAEADEVDHAVAAFVDAVAERVGEGRLAFDAGKGIDVAALARLEASDPRPALHRQVVDDMRVDDRLLGIGAVAAATAATGSTDGWTASVEPGPDAASIRAALAEAGIDASADTLDAQVDVLFCGARQGVLDGATSETVGARIVVPIGAHAVSAKGLAVLAQRGVVTLPDFVTLAGPSFAGWPEGEATVDAVVTDCRAGITRMVTDALAHPEGPFLGACAAAETFLATWQDELPFGRPLA
jgi:glutamate dehydrogenase/leucine dehydrogenase